MWWDETLIWNQAELAIADVSGNGAGIVAAANTVISTFALVFVAEWGDKSFFSTIGIFFFHFFDFFFNLQLLNTWDCSNNHIILFLQLSFFFSFLCCAALAAASSPLGVVGGALAGHAAATLVGLSLKYYLIE